MYPGKDVEKFLENLEWDAFSAVIVHGEVDPEKLSASPPNLAQIWRFMQMLRIQLQDIRDCVGWTGPKPKVQKKRKKKEGKSVVAPKIKKIDVDEIAQ